MNCFPQADIDSFDAAPRMMFMLRTVDGVPVMMRTFPGEIQVSFDLGMTWEVFQLRRIQSAGGPINDVQDAGCVLLDIQDIIERKTFEEARATCRELARTPGTIRLETYA
jgi:hypothetical protein